MPFDTCSRRVMPVCECTLKPIPFNLTLKVLLFHLQLHPRPRRAFSTGALHTQRSSRVLCRAGAESSGNEAAVSCHASQLRRCSRTVTLCLRYTSPDCKLPCRNAAVSMHALLCTWTNSRPYDFLCVFAAHCPSQVQLHARVGIVHGPARAHPAAVTGRTSAKFDAASK